MSRLCFLYGTVHAGKTKSAYAIRNRFLKYHLSTMIMAPTTTHQDDISNYDYLIGKEENIFLTIKRQFNSLRLILIDDANLLNEVQVDQLLQVAISQNIAIICFGLRTDFRTSEFPGAKRLLEIAQVVKEIPTKCTCGNKALFNVRKENGKTTFSGTQIKQVQEITYEALCPKCYYHKVMQYKKLKESGIL